MKPSETDKFLADIRFKRTEGPIRLGQVYPVPKPGTYIAEIIPYKPEVPVPPEKPPEVPVPPETMFDIIEAIAELAKTRPERYGAGF